MLIGISEPVSCCFFLLPDPHRRRLDPVVRRPGPAITPWHRSTLRRHAQGMANVDDEHTSATGRAQGRWTESPPASGPSARIAATWKYRPREDDEHIHPHGIRPLLDVYDSSFRTSAEGEVVKGPSSGDRVGSRSSTSATVRRHHPDQRAPRRAGPGGGRGRRFSSTCCSSAPKTGKATSSSRAEKAEKMKNWTKSRRPMRAQGRDRPRHRANQGRLAVDIGVRAFPPVRRSTCVPFGTWTRCAGRSSHARHQGEQEARQHRAVAQGAAGRRERREERRTRSARSPKARSWAMAVKNITDYGAFIDLGGILTGRCTSPTSAAASATPRSCSR